MITRSYIPMKHEMLKTTLFAVALFLGVSSAAGAGDLPRDGARGSLLPPSEEKAFLERLKKVRSAVQTLDAAFKEERTVSPLDRELTYEGRLYYDAQGIFFMDYKKPIRHILRVSASEAVSYVEGSSTADVMDISSMEGAGAHPHLFGWDGEGFQGSVRETPEVYVMEMPRGEAKGKSGAPRATIVLDKERLLPVKIQVVNGGGDRTIILLSDIHVNRELPPFVTDFSLPGDVKENRMGPQ